MTVLLMRGVEVDWNQKLDPTMMVMWDRHATNGKIVRGSLRTIAHIDMLHERSLRRFGQPYLVIQPPYNTGVPASKGTHDFDVMRDWYIPGISWWTMQRFGRSNGEFVWYRHPPLFGNHCHGGTLPVPEGHVRSDDFATRVGVFVSGQLVDYYNHAFGLAGQHTPGSDNSWFPSNIDATVFDLDRRIQVMRERNMQYSDWSQESKDEMVGDIVKALLRDSKVKVRKSKDPEKGMVEISIKAAIARAGSAVAVTREATDDVMAAIDAANSTGEEV